MLCHFTHLQVALQLDSIRNAEAAISLTQHLPVPSSNANDNHRNHLLWMQARRAEQEHRSVNESRVQASESRQPSISAVVAAAPPLTDKETKVIFASWESIKAVDNDVYTCLAMATEYGRDDILLFIFVTMEQVGVNIQKGLRKFRLECPGNRTPSK